MEDLTYSIVKQKREKEEGREKMGERRGEKVVGRKKGGERRGKEKGVREGKERRGREERGERRGRKREKEGERKRGKRGEREEKEREGGTIHLSHLVPQNLFRNKFLCKNISVLIEREKRINKSFTG